MTDPRCASPDRYGEPCVPTERYDKFAPGPNGWGYQPITVRYCIHCRQPV